MFEQVAELLDDLEVAGAGLPVGRLLERIAAVEQAVAVLQAAQLRDLAAFNAAFLAGVDAPAGGPPGPVGPLEAKPDPDLPGLSRCGVVEVAQVLRVAPVTARCRLNTAVRAVDDHPRLLDLLGSGAVSAAGLGRVLETTAVLGPEQQQVVDGQLAAEAARRAWTPGELGRAAHRRVLQADPDSAARRVARARRDRYVRVVDPVDATAGIVARLRAEEAAAIIGGLDGTARAMRSAGDPRDLDALRADLFVEALTGRPMVRVHGLATDGEPAGQAPRPMVWRSVDGGESAFGLDPPPLPEPVDPPLEDPVWDRYVCDSGRADPAPPDPTLPDPVAMLRRLRRQSDPDPPEPRVGPASGSWRHRHDVEVQVVVSLATLLGLDEQPGVLRGYGSIPAQTVLDIVETAEAVGATTRLRGLFCDPVDGRLLTMESAARRFTGGLRRFCAWRDQADRLTGGHLGDIDHVLSVADGGRTTAANGQGLGQTTNRTIKEHPAVTAWTVPVQRHDGLDDHRVHAPDIGWTLPTGRTLHSAPPPVLGPGSDPADHTPDDPAHQALEAELFALLDAQAGP